MTTLRARQQAATHALDWVPACFVSAAHRPDLTIAVSEKRRQEADARVAASGQRSEEKELS